MNPVHRPERRLSPRARTFDLVPLLFVGWSVAVPDGELGLGSRLLLFAAFIAVVRLMANEIRPHGFLRQRILILGSGPMAAKLISEIESVEHPRYVVAGIVDDEPPAACATDNVLWLGAFANLADIVQKVQPARIVVAVADRRQRLPLQPLLDSRVRGIVVEDALDFYEQLTGKMAIEALTPSNLILAKGFRNHGAAEITARVVSVVVAALALIAVLPVLVALAIAIKLDSKGPVLFVQDRAGRHGKPFGLLKFRSMHPTEHHASEWVRDNEDRITRIGKWLRRFRLDELPQLVNVLRGEMNLVGPRPHPIGNHDMFLEQIAYYRIRSSVRPGVTGWAQVRYGYANDLEEETEKMRYDLYYIKNRTLWLDARILVGTVAIMVFGHGASATLRPPAARPREITSAPSRRRTDEAAYGHWLMGAGAARHPAGRQ